jgi:membrane-associated phospholipid phosphatase
VDVVTGGIIVLLILAVFTLVWDFAADLITWSREQQ